MRDLVRQARLLEGCNGVAAADDGDSAVFRSLGDSLSNSERAFCKSIKLEYAHRSVPDDRLSAFKSLRVLFRRLLAGIECLPAIRYFVDVNRLRVGIGSELVGNDEVDRQDDLDALVLCLLEQLASEVVLVRLAEGIANRQAFGCIKRMSHAAADDDRVDLVDHVADDADLIGDLCAADDGNERMLRVLERLADVVDFLFHQEASDRLDVLRNACVRSMSAVGNTESIVDCEVAAGSELLRELRIVLLLFLVVAEVLKQQDFARLQRSLCGVCLSADAVGCPLDIAAEQLGEVLDEVLRGELVLASLGRAADVAGDDESCTVVEQVVQGRQRADHARVVRDVHLVIERDVVVDADEYFLAVYVNVFDGFLVHRKTSKVFFS